MKRLLVGSFVALAVVVFASLIGSARAGGLNCSESEAVLCAETNDSIGYAGEYTGHDEPSLLFYSNSPGSGNSNLYKLQLPTDPKVLPNQSGTAGTFNFQLHPAFWVGMALCDNQSAPEFTHAPCTADSDTNIFDGTDPNAADYIGHHPGTAFLELQFYPPGWAPWPPGVSCDPKQWCAAMAIFSLLQDQNNAILNNNDCRARAGDEPANFAFITKSGVPHGPAAPLSITNGTFTPNSATDLFMNSGDQLSIDIHDGAAGLTTIVHDLTTGKTGSMTASAANGFAQVMFEPASPTCHQSPYTFRPMYSTSSEHTRVPWAAHSYNVAFSDEIGHFEYCDAITGEGGDCTANSESTLDGDDSRLLQRGVLDVRPDHGLHRVRQRLRRCAVPEGLARNRSEPRAGHEVPPGPGHVHEPALQRHAELQSRCLRGRPAADRSAGLRRHLRPVHGRELREPAAGLELLPDLHHRHVDAEPERQRALRLAARRAVHQGHDEHVRRKLGGRVRPAAVQLLPESEPCDSAEDEQLPQHPRQQSLPGLAAAA